MSFIGKLKVGTEVLVSNTPKFVDKKATVMFVGKLPGGGKNQEFIGVELQTPDGTHSGQFEGKEYFKAKENHGMFAKPKAVKLADGTLLSTLLTAPTKQATRTGTVKAPTTQPKPGTTRAPLGGSKKQPQTKPSLVDQNKLSQQLKELQLNQQIESLKEQNESLKQSIQSLKEQVEQSKKKIEILQSTDTQQQLIAMRQRIRELQDQSRMLRVQQQKAKLQTSQSSEEKTKQLQQKIEFFNSQKQFHQKQKADLKKKILRLQQQLDSYEGNLQEFEKLTYKVQNLQAKNVKLREQLEQYKTQTRNNQMLNKGGKSSVSDESKLEQLEENIKVLNETVSLMQGELEEERQRAVGLQVELQALKAKGGDVSRLQKKLKSRDQQLQALKAQLQVTSDAATFAQKLTLDLLRKQQQLKQTTHKLTQYLNQIQSLQVQISQSKQMIDLQTLQLQTQQQQIQKHINEKQQQQLHIGELNKQIAKYKGKIMQLTQNNQSLLSTNSQIMTDANADYQMSQTLYSSKLLSSIDTYQQRYFQTLKTVQQLSERYYQLQLQSSQIKNIVGVQMLNLIQTIPESYTQQFYPEIVGIIIDIKSVNDKLYLLFDAASTYMRTRGDIYVKDNIEKARFLVMLMQQLPLLYSQLTKIQLSLTTASSQEEITDIVSNIAIKQMLRKIDYAASQMLLKFSGDNIDPSIDLGPFIDPVQTLDNICAQGRKLEYEYETRNKLCLETMTAVQKIFAAILTLKEVSELKQSAQVDNIIEAFLKHLLQYLNQCCNNPQLRIKTQTKQYLSNLQFTINLLEEIQINQTINELSSLYSQVEEIKMLKEAILSTHHHLKQLIDDLGEIVYPNELSKIKCNLSGKVWQQRSASINQELGRVQELTTEKQGLHANLFEAKKKIIILEKQIKDRQATKQLYEKRIGELQLKVEQASTFEVQNKRYKDKLRTYEDTNKLIEDELQSQVTKRKELQDDVRKLKDKIHALQTQGLQKSKEKKVSPLASSTPSEEVTSLALFKNVLKECDFLKTVELKKKILQIKQSPLIAKLNLEDQKESMESKSTNIAQNIRRKVINAMCEIKIVDPRIKDHKEKSALINSNLVLKSLQIQVDKYNFDHPNPENKPKQDVVEMKIGSFLLKSRSQNLSAKLSVSNFKIMSF